MPVSCPGVGASNRAVIAYVQVALPLYPSSEHRAVSFLHIFAAMGAKVTTRATRVTSEYSSGASGVDALGMSDVPMPSARHGAASQKPTHLRLADMGRTLVATFMGTPHGARRALVEDHVLELALQPMEGGYPVPMVTSPRM